VLGVPHQLAAPVVTDPTAEQLLAHDARLRRMLADPECVGELLLVGIGMARCVDLGDPPWAEDGYMDLREIADRIYGRRQLSSGNILGTIHYDRADISPRKRIRGVFFADRRRYSAEVDGDRGFHGVTCGRPMVRREGVCGRNPAHDLRRRLTDPVTGQRRTIAACSQKACRAWFADLLARNAAELKQHPAPQPPANTGGVLQRHLPELNWTKIWARVDETWRPPPEGERFERPRLTLLHGDDDTPVTVPRPALVVHKGGWL
jgi:hypothetical protein